MGVWNVIGVIVLMVVSFIVGFFFGMGSDLR